MPVLRVLLIFMNISEIRIFNFIVLLCLLIYFLYLVSKKFGVTIAFIFAYSLIVYDYLFVSFSISAVSVYLIFMIASIILLKNIEKIKNLGIYFFLIGCFTSSMDLLSVPLLTLVIPLFICILNDKQNNTQSFGKIFKYCVLWAIGYGLTWISKWVIYDLIYHQNIILNALETTRYRASQTGDYSVIIINIIKSLVIVFFGIIVLLIKMFVKKEKISFENWFKQNKELLFTTFLPILWYFIILEHSAEHIFFTYKLITGFVIGMLLLFNNLTKSGKDVEIKCQNQKK